MYDKSNLQKKFSQVNSLFYIFPYIIIEIKCEIYILSLPEFFKFYWESEVNYFTILKLFRIVLLYMLP